MGTFGETEAHSPTYPLARRNNQVWSLLKFFALTYGVSWACFLAAVAMSHGSASALPALTAGRWLLLLLGTFAPSLVALGSYRRTTPLSPGRVTGYVGLARFAMCVSERVLCGPLLSSYNPSIRHTGRSHGKAVPINTTRKSCGDPRQGVLCSQSAFRPIRYSKLPRSLHDKPNRGENRHFLAMPFEPPCFAPEFFFDAGLLSVVHRATDDRVIADQMGL